MVPIAAVLAFVLVGRAQDAPPPVFHGGVDLVSFEISVVRRVAFGLVSRPYTKLTADDVTIVFEGTTYPAVKVDQNPKRPGHYVVSFAPPDEYRDGQPHTYRVTVKTGGPQPLTLPPSSVTIPKRTDTTPPIPSARWPGSPLRPAGPESASRPGRR